MLAELLEDYANVPARAALSSSGSVNSSVRPIALPTTRCSCCTRPFVTPFDRDDIHRMISRMDDILDLMEDAAESLLLYDIQAVEPEASHLADLVRICCERGSGCNRFALSLDEKCTIHPDGLPGEIDGLESDADRVMRGAISRLFATRPMCAR